MLRKGQVNESEALKLAFEYLVDSIDAASLLPGALNRQAHNRQTDRELTVSTKATRTRRRKSL